MEFFYKLLTGKLLEATSHVEEGYFRLPVADGDDPNQDDKRMSLFFRTIPSTTLTFARNKLFPYAIHGEVDKS